MWWETLFNLKFWIVVSVLLVFGAMLVILNGLSVMPFPDVFPDPSQAKAGQKV